MKKIQLLAAVIYAAFAVTACGASGPGTTPPEPVTDTEVVEETAEEPEAEAPEETPAEPEAEEPEETPAEPEEEVPEETPAEPEEEAPAETPSEKSAHEKMLPGHWYDTVSQRAGMTIYTETDGIYRVNIHWAGSYNESSEWAMDCHYDAVQDALLYTDGVHYYSTFRSEEDQDVEEREMLWENGQGRLYFDGDNLLWEDTQEEQAEGRIFERVYSEPVGADVMKEEYVDAVLRMEPGTAGSSLKEAQTAYEALSFAYNYNIMNVDREQAAADLQSALEALSEEEKTAFEQNESRINEIILHSATAQNLGDFKGAFEDAGVYEEMSLLVGIPDAVESWRVLHMISAGEID